MGKPRERLRQLLRERPIRDGQLPQVDLLEPGEGLCNLLQLDDASRRQGGIGRIMVPCGHLHS